MEGIVEYRRLKDSGDVVNLSRLWEILQILGDLQFEEICWNWNCCRFTWHVFKKSPESYLSPSRGAVWGYLGGRFDIRSLWGLYKMYDTLWFCLVSG